MKNIIKPLFLLAGILLSVKIFAQQHHALSDTSKPRQKEEPMIMNGMKMDTVQRGDNMKGGDNMKAMNHESLMNSSFSLNLPMNRNGSGTAWLPDASSMFADMFHSGKWMFMLHGNLFIRYDSQDLYNKGSRGDNQVDAPNWLMFMGQRKVARNGLFHFSTMVSLDPVTEGGRGYPLLFQSGESYKGKPIIDRQHPHDLFSELAVSYTQAFSKKTDVYIYIGYPGEPAVGPVAFMHRPSALENPDAPLSHHWVDATHITFGVTTIGMRYGNFKIEGSSFTGREPDENRYNFDKPLFDSWSGRVSYNPSSNWALQISKSFIKSPEFLHPNENINRTTASAIYSSQLRDNSTIDGTAIWGQNKSAGQEGENAILLEGAWRKKRVALHSRYEWVQKSSEELGLDESIYGADHLFPVNAFTLGFNYDLLKMGKIWVAGGGQFTYYHADERLNTLYGKDPLAFEVFLRLYPGLISMKQK